jgi:glycerol-3-phosphate acyltransferase PlsY
MLELLNFGLVYHFGLVEYRLDPGIFSVRVGSGAALPIIIIMYLVLIAAGYLLGSLNAGIIISRLAYRDDIRNHGSGNAGMTNMLRTYGKSAAAVTFLCDGMKTVIAVFIGVILFGNHDGPMALFAGPYVGGLASIVGHAFPVYYNFKGGKSVAATLFMVLCTAPFVALICLLIFIIIVAWTKYISLGSVMAVMIYPMVLNRLTGIGLHNLIAVVIMLLVMFLHRGNISRLGAGIENKIDLKSKKKKNTAEADNPVSSPEEGEK